MFQLILITSNGISYNFLHHQYGLLELLIILVVDAIANKNINSMTTLSVAGKKEPQINAIDAMTDSDVVNVK